MRLYFRLLSVLRGQPLFRVFRVFGGSLTQCTPWFNQLRLPTISIPFDRFNTCWRYTAVRLYFRLLGVFRGQPLFRFLTISILFNRFNPCWRRTAVRLYFRLLRVFGGYINSVCSVCSVVIAVCSVVIPYLTV